MSKKPDMKGGRPKAKKGTLGRVLKFLFKSYKPLLCIVLVCLVISALTNSISSIFTEKIARTHSTAIWHTHRRIRASINGFTHAGATPVSSRS